ncbi:hypothetical protein [Sphingomonas sp. TX0522]|uniref:hypothetical protein n=1 Tax=Sphingomonas sp. TX0522 TaxID=2479205 RepID=UPI0018DFB1AA|nr:hypothetical protein [Sphingomonas sp. TX0522]MBI0530350.1 hypothetical protein [Sphingomonas sp. TX0522]
MLKPHAPVVFLNPAIVLAGSRAMTIGLVPSAGAPTGGAIVMGHPPVAAITHLCDRLGALLVCTASTDPYDARDQLLSDGVRAPFAVDWRTDWANPDRAAAVTRWHEEHGRPAAVFVDRQGFDVPGLRGITVPAHLTLTVAHVDRLLLAVRSGQGHA